jgi:dGTPase
MDWDNLLSAARYEEPVRPDIKQRSVYQRDGDRIIFSSAFRRLQDKTQVHPFATSDYVRKRLTHSLEVASVGRSLGYWLGACLSDEHPHLLKVHPSLAYDLAQIVSNACLAHDIGNPPFGHAGEEAIGAWFKRHANEPILEQLDSHERLDFERFEGDAQGFRLVIRLQNSVNEGGLRLTDATLGAFTKYPSTSVHAASDDTYIGCKKHGYFKEDLPQFAKAAGRMGLVQRSDTSWCRHPLVFLVEAADDICYRIVDVEDGFKLGRLTFEEVEGCLVSMLSSGRSYKREADDSSNVGWLRAAAIGSVIDAVQEAFLENQKQIIDGTFSSALVDCSRVSQSVRQAKQLVISRVFDWERTVVAEIAGSEMITVVLNRAMQAVADPSPKANHLVLKMVPGYDPGSSFLRRVHAVTDFVSGMTDTYLKSTFLRFTGHAI